MQLNSFVKRNLLLRIFILFLFTSFYWIDYLDWLKNKDSIRSNEGTFGELHGIIQMSLYPVSIIISIFGSKEVKPIYLRLLWIIFEIGMIGAFQFVLLLIHAFSTGGAL